MKTIRPIRRTRGPVISWGPAHDSHYIVAGMRGAAAGIPPLHITQAGLLEFESLVVAGRSPVQFGLLAGALCFCPATKVDYLLIDQVLPARAELTADEPLVQLAAELEALISDVERGRKLAIGWYLGGMDSDLRLDAEVELLHRKLFPQVWQVVLVRSQESGEHGAFSRFEAATERFYTIPFFELLTPARRARPSELRTAVRWTNYRAAHSVVRLDAPPAAPRTDPARPLFAGSDSPVRSWLGTIRRRLTPVSERIVPDAPRALSPSPAVSRGATSRADRDAPASTASVRSDALPTHHAANPPPNGAVPSAASHVVRSEALVKRQIDGAGMHSEPSPAPADIPQIFINGVLVPLPVPGERTVDTPSAVGVGRRALLGAITLFVLALALAAYVIGR